MIRPLILAGLACLPALAFGACGAGDDPPPDQAPATATQLTVGVWQADSLAPMGVHHATFTATGDAHVVSLTQLESDASWALYAAPDYESRHMLGCDGYAGRGDEICVAETLAAGQPYYLRIDEWDGVAGGFTLAVD